MPQGCSNLKHLRVARVLNYASSIREDVMKGFLLTASLLLASTSAFAAEPLVASLPSPATTVSGTVEVNQPECECAPIVTIVDGDSRTLVSADHSFLKKLAKQSGKTVTVEGSLETFRNDETGTTKLVIDADRFVDARTAKK